MTGDDHQSHVAVVLQAAGIDAQPEDVTALANAYPQLLEMVRSLRAVLAAEPGERER